MLRAVRMAASKLMLPLAVIAGISAGNIRRSQAQSADIPLQLISFGTGSSQTYSLGINVGIGSSAPKPYLFDTGSAPFNAAYSPQWWPSSITPTSPPPLITDVSYSYATGTTLTGNIVAVPSISFYASSLATTPSYTLPTLTPGYQVTAITSSTIPDFSNLIQNNQPFIRGTFFGVFGAGDFVNIINASGGGMATLGGVLGQSTISGTTAGYVVAANGQRISTMNGPQGTQTVTNCSPCVIVGLTPSLLAQFTTIVPWSGKSSAGFPNSGAPSSLQFGNTFNLSLTCRAFTHRFLVRTYLVGHGHGKHDPTRPSRCFRLSIESTVRRSPRGMCQQRHDAIRRWRGARGWRFEPNHARPSNERSDLHGHPENPARGSGSRDPFLLAELGAV